MTWSDVGFTLKTMGSVAIAMAFILHTAKDWVNKGEPVAGNPLVKVKTNAVRLLDRLIFEYLTRQWAGSSDSKIARMLREMPMGQSLLEPVQGEEWTGLVNKHLSGEIQLPPPRQEGKKTAIDSYTKLLLVYEACLGGRAARPSPGLKFDVDHLIPEGLFETIGTQADREFRNRITNLSLLPSGPNRSKKDRSLGSLTDSPDDLWLKSEIAQYSQVPVDRFSDFSKPSQAKDLHEYRKKKFIEAFTTKRATWLS